MATRRKRHSGPKSPFTTSVRSIGQSPNPSKRTTPRKKGSVNRSPTSRALTVGDFATRGDVETVLTSLSAQCQADAAASALIPWFCDALASPKSRRDYFSDLRRFFGHMRRLGVHPYHVTGDHVRLYKEALQRAGRRPASVARALSVIRGTYEQFGKKGLVPWPSVGDIQAVTAPRVTKNTTPVLGERDACRMLHAPDLRTLIGCRDHALLFTYFKTACRSSAIARTTFADLERSDTEWFLRVTEKGKRERLLPLLEAAPAVLHWIDRAGIATEPATPLFPALSPDRRTPTTRPLSGRQILNIVKKYARQVGLNVDPGGRRGICTHSLRKTCAVNALRHGAAVHQVQHWLGHADIRTTQEYVAYHDDDVDQAARRCQIR